MNEASNQIKQLSSGTIATITGFSEYVDIDWIQQKWFKWSLDKNHKNWMQSWELFKWELEKNETCVI